MNNSLEITFLDQFSITTKESLTFTAVSRTTNKLRHVFFSFQVFWIYFMEWKRQITSTSPSYSIAKWLPTKNNGQTTCLFVYQIVSVKLVIVLSRISWRYTD